MDTNIDWIALDIVISDDWQDILIGEMDEWGFEGFEQETDRLVAYIPASRLDDSIREDLERWLAAHGRGAHIAAERAYAPRNWNEEWERTIQPMEVGPFWVHPSWYPGDKPAHLTALEIDPKMAFGTGYHETTRLLLRALDGLVRPGVSVLDVGTGTGILAIAALRLGAGSAFGFDIDEWSAVNATENAWLNGVQDRFSVAEGSFETVPEGAIYGLVFANVIRDMLLTYAEEIIATVAPGGDLLLSGLLAGDRSAILAHPPYAALQTVAVTGEGDWIAIHLRKP